MDFFMMLYRVCSWYVHAWIDFFVSLFLMFGVWCGCFTFFCVYACLVYYEAVELHVYWSNDVTCKSIHMAAGISFEYHFFSNGLILEKIIMDNVQFKLSRSLAFVNCSASIFFFHLDFLFFVTRFLFYVWLSDKWCFKAVFFADWNPY